VVGFFSRVDGWVCKGTPAILGAVRRGGTRNVSTVEKQSSRSERPAYTPPAVAGSAGLA
jgi:hypothetical protein